MGDRCWIQITFRKEDQKKFEEILGEDWYTESEEYEHVITGQDYEANYGLYDEREKLAEAGLTFNGCHGAGGDYGDIAFACYKGKHIEINANHDGRPVASVLPDGTVPHTEKKEAIKYWKIWKQAVEYIHEEENKKL